ncbi:hypothetical protein HED60_16835 [Planctomycetales bacterium ZRK34]|nr:hypothetical protein HED60_16835 [Planctomycetales bacterium ZRK34]
MNRKSLGGLIVLNVVLLLALGLLTFTPEPAAAQLGGRAGDYVMVAGATPGRTEATVYITDMNNGLMMAVQYDQNRKIVQPTGFRNIGADFAEGGGR